MATTRATPKTKSTKTKQKRTTHGPARKAGSTAAKRASRPRAKTAPSAEPSLGTRAVNALAGSANAVRALVPQLSAGKDTASGLLESQHREVEQSFETALASEDTRIRRTAMNDIIRQLTMHTTIEEEIFYPAVRGLGTEDAKHMILEALEEHHVVKLVLKELPQVDPKADSFEAKMTVLKELVAHHVKEEEREMFPLAELELGAERSRELAAAMEARAARG